MISMGIRLVSENRVGILLPLDLSDINNPEVRETIPTNQRYSSQSLK